MDPRRVNGGTFLGLNGIAIKSHGGTDALGFASAVDLGYEMAESGLVARLTADLATFHDALAGLRDAGAELIARHFGPVAMSPVEAIVSVRGSSAGPRRDAAASRRR